MPWFPSSPSILLYASRGPALYKQQPSFVTMRQLPLPFQSSGYKPSCPRWVQLQLRCFPGYHILSPLFLLSALSFNCKFLHPFFPVPCVGLNTACGWPIKIDIWVYTMQRISCMCHLQCRTVAWSSHAPFPIGRCVVCFLYVMFSQRTLQVYKYLRAKVFIQQSFCCEAYGNL